MAEALADKIIRSIKQASALYHRLIILVAPAGSGKTMALQNVSKQTGAPLINVNLQLSTLMLDLTERQRVLQLPRLLSEIVNESSTDVVLFDNIEVLFDISLKQDPLRLLQGLSRNKSVVTTWNGLIDNKHLTYAVPNHREYRRYPIHGLLVVSPEVTNIMEIG